RRPALSPHATPHPRLEVLAAFGYGRLSGPTADAVATHLDGCAACAARLENLPGDPFLSALPDAARPADPPPLTSPAHPPTPPPPRGPRVPRPPGDPAG